jgi:ComF family protein
MGLKLSKSPHYQQVDVVVCVPLHPLKEKKRGYNQSAVFGESLAEAMGIPFVKNALYRNTHSLSQTKQKRLHRYTNVENVFQVRLPHKLKGKHVLLVDDVLTTGATLECCAQQILEVPGTRISMATIAIA